MPALFQELLILATLRGACSGLCQWRFVAVFVLPLWDQDAHSSRIKILSSSLRYRAS